MHPYSGDIADSHLCLEGNASLAKTVSRIKKEQYIEEVSAEGRDWKERKDVERRRKE